MDCFFGAIRLVVKNGLPSFGLTIILYLSRLEISKEKNMSVEEVSVKKTGLTIGFYLGLFTGVYSIALYYLGAFENGLLGLISRAVFILTLFVGMKQFRDKLNGGFLTYSKGVKLGVVISLSTGFVSGLFLLVLVKFIAPEFIGLLIDKALLILSESGLPESQIVQAEKMYRKLFTPGSLVFFEIIGQAIIGTLISLILAAIVKKDKPPFEVVSE